VLSGANDHRGIVRRVREARRAYRGPFTGEEVQRVVSAAGYTRPYEAGEDEFLIFEKDGCRPVPINPNWDEIWDDDPIFRCLRRDLGMSRGKLARS
jgi:hypothetical protein